jgi:hypothetical protein
MWSKAPRHSFLVAVHVPRSFPQLSMNTKSAKEETQEAQI